MNSRLNFFRSLKKIRSLTEKSRHAQYIFVRNLQVVC